MDIPRDHHPLNLIRALGDLEDLRVAHPYALMWAVQPDQVERRLPMPSKRSSSDMHRVPELRQSVQLAHQSLNVAEVVLNRLRAEPCLVEVGMQRPCESELRAKLPVAGLVG